MTMLDNQQLIEYIVENQNRFYRLAYSYLSNREDTLDTVQNAVCKALQNHGRLRKADALHTWFYRILVYECIDRLRARKKLQFCAPEALDSEYYEDPLPQDISLQQRVNALMPEVQTVIRLHFYEELTLQEISEITGWNLNTVKTRLYGGLRKLRVTMEGESDYE